MRVSAWPPWKASNTRRFMRRSLNSNMGMQQIGLLQCRPAPVQSLHPPLASNRPRELLDAYSK